MNQDKLYAAAFDKLEKKVDVSFEELKLELIALQNTINSMLNRKEENKNDTK